MGAVSTPRRLLGGGPQSRSLPAPKPAERPGTAAQRAADQPPAPAAPAAPAHRQAHPRARLTPVS
ncbi:hypothetical protein J2X68_007227 [Streptomyces sp. 3330]|nr:hypothetical protein [Streptomyces sp. 3330]